MRSCSVAQGLYHFGVSTILAADETGTLHLPPALLPEPGPHRRYRVAAENGQVVVDQAPPGTAPWMELAGCLAGEAEELRRLDGAIADEFERVNSDDWQ